MTIFSLILILFANETFVKPLETSKSSFLKDYDPIFKDRQFLPFIYAMTLTTICVSFMWILLPVYAKQQYQIQENVYGFIPMTNALMIVFLQVIVSTQTKRFLALPVLTVGSLFYAIGVASIAFGNNFFGFFVSIIIITIGELIIVPTAVTYTAALASPETRGRYMGILNLIWRIAMGIGPLLGGLLNDHISPQAVWFGGGAIGLLSTLWFFFLANQTVTAD
jgi:MFS family permease